ncbi:MAG: Cof-type HAD-IIB family hydrolase [Bacteroidales bacterium]|nr:Cof-type HAD-IIB family hydrolase [Bacteroidales bacterium]
MIKSLFFDIDGTLVSFNTHTIPDSTIAALELAHKNGVKIFISTGRPKVFVINLKQIEHLISGYILNNGAVSFVGNETVSCHPIPPNEVDIIINDAQQFDYPYIIMGEKDFAVVKFEPVVDRIFDEELKIFNIRNGKTPEEVLKQRIFQITPFIYSDHEKHLLPKIPGCMSNRWNPEFTDITSKFADKGKGLTAMAEHLGLQISETMAFGDGGNDIPIIRCAGVGVAMGNADDDVKQVADYVTNTVDEDGVYNALKHFNVI